jgi:predicted amidohydrolase YtcJ
MTNAADAGETSKVRVFAAKRIVTMDPGRPTADAVAVMDGRILSVGSLESMRPWLDRYDAIVDETFADKVLFPGFIDPHTHFAMSGAFLGLNYVGPIPSPGPQGMNPALTSRTAVMDHLSALHEGMEDRTRPLFAWGFDPAIQGGQLDRDALDEVSRERPIWVIAYAPHFVYVNTPMLEQLGATEDLELHGLGRDADGRLNGQFIEVAAVQYALNPFREEVMRPDRNAEAIRMLGQTGKRAGVTTTADMAFGFTNFDKEWDEYDRVIRSPDYPMRMVLTPVELGIQKRHQENASAFVESLDERSDDKLRFHGIKFINDGSYPAMSLRLKFPGYLDGGNGLRGDVPWEELADRMYPYWERGIPIHAHANGDEAVDAVLDALAELQQRKPRFDHRFTIEHYCISTTDQARRLKALGGLASVNNYFVHYRSQLHSDQGFGPDRSEATARLGSLEREGVTFALHSDFSLVVVPLHPLTAVWAAVNRIAADNQTVLAPGERIGVERAMRAITIDAAYVLGLERELGSIEVSKLADFTVLDDDPLEADPLTIRDIPIWGTVLGGVKHPA